MVMAADISKECSAFFGFTSPIIVPMGGNPVHGTAT